MATTKNIQSLERAFSILELFQKTGRAEHSIKEISDALQLNKSTTFGLVNTMASLGYLKQNNDNQKYALGLKLLNFSHTVQVQNIVFQSVHPFLEQLTQKYGETTHCAVLHNDGVIYIDKVEASDTILISTQIGSQNDFHYCGVGKCILAYMPPEAQERYYNTNLKTKTHNTISNSQQLREEIRRVRVNGYATDDEESVLGLSCVAVPVFSAPDTVACSISVSGITSRIQAAKDKGIINELKWIAATISKKKFHYHYTVNEI